MKGKNSTIRKILSTIVLAGLLVAGFTLAFPSGKVAASALVQEPQPPADAAKIPDPVQLEKAFQRELDLLKGQADRLTKLNERAVKFGERITKLKDEGKDVTALEVALADYKSNISDARSQHEKAAQILNTHAGFDANGKVTDAAKAAETIKDAGKIMRGIHVELRSIVRDLLQAMRKFIRDNRGK